MMEINWTNYFFHADFSTCAEALNQLQTGQVIDAGSAVTLAAVLQQCDIRASSGNWVASGPELDWNVNGATVVFAGANSPKFATNSKFTNVVILEFAEGCKAPSGKIYLQYNLPSGGV